jgi:hypothetical protein
MSEQPARDPVLDLLDTTQRETQDLVTAICQVHTDRVRDLLSRDLRGQVMQIIDERFSQLELALRPRMARARLEVARGITQVLSDCFTRMRRFDSDRHWCEALLDATAAMSRRSAFFSLRSEKLCFQGARGLDAAIAAPMEEVPYRTALGFARAIDTGEIHTVARTEAELSAAVTRLFGEDREGRALLVPLTVEGERAPGVIYCEDPVDPTAIQSIATVAAAVLEKHLRLLEPVARPSSAPGVVRAVPLTPDAPPVAVNPAHTAPRAEPPADPAAAPARRFAQVAVARLMLKHESAIAQGRSSGALYSALREQIDAMRVSYRAKFNGGRDHLHEEMVATLARGDVSLLGKDYPGPHSAVEPDS